MIKIFDTFISMTLLIILLPVFLIISILILIFDGRPIIYRQIRVGYNGEKFKIFKFRTIKNKIIKNENLRVTKLQILRKTSLVKYHSY